MTTIIKATYVQGVFRPQEPIALPEGTQVELTLTLPPEGLRGARLIREAAESHAAVAANSDREGLVEFAAEIAISLDDVDDNYYHN
jgi:predicted DNA-binding antitoxin AbrB/MazE fold protein